MTDTVQEEYWKAQEAFRDALDEGADYKDYAEASYRACAAWVDSGRATPEFRAWFDRAPDGTCCPRAWSEYN